MFSFNGKFDTPLERSDFVSFQNVKIGTNSDGERSVKSLSVCKTENTSAADSALDDGGLVGSVSTSDGESGRLVVGRDFVRQLSANGSVLKTRCDCKSLVEVGPECDAGVASLAKGGDFEVGTSEREDGAQSTNRTGIGKDFDFGTQRNTVISRTDDGSDVGFGDLGFETDFAEESGDRKLQRSGEVSVVSSKFGLSLELSSLNGVLDRGTDGEGGLDQSLDGLVRSGFEGELLSQVASSGERKVVGLELRFQFAVEGAVAGL